MTEAHGANALPIDEAMQLIRKAEKGNRKLTSVRVLKRLLNVIEWDDGIYGTEAAQHSLIPQPHHSTRRVQPSEAPLPRERRRNLIVRLMRHLIVPKDLS
jgi:hypothetical protein